MLLTYSIAFSIIDFTSSSSLIASSEFLTKERENLSNKKIHPHFLFSCYNKSLTE
jgi:hypothetical protein